MKRFFLTITATIAIVSLVSAQKKLNQDSLVKEAAKTELWEPVPAMVSTQKPFTDAPSDAIVLMNGKDLNSWHKELDKKAVGWKLDKEGITTVVKGSGNIETNQAFGNCQLHVEWREPSAIAGSSQTRGNSGIFLMGR